ncbi:hypothetical protein C8A05DRAFT_48141 [Staphylotrichum tortipilum]|uniref:Aminoglycoside phosphotransferase domain-containing protein n=1 Tax=Staphylotrichum tortipilum TaxID=2831512 RepID=A0AAN6MAD6_9PEZI|nr:hypothetical protein C8A05DRAFT_48141 [Staphylotrichum longicolle]
MDQRYFSCSAPNCPRPSARSHGAGSYMCHRHFCGVHMSPDFHKCKTADLDDAAYDALILSEISLLRAQTNDQALRALASRLNRNIPCTIEHPNVVGPGALMGCANYHPWLLRVPRVSGFAVSLPVLLAEYPIRSEYATLKFLETTAVPPRGLSRSASRLREQTTSSASVSFSWKNSQASRGTARLRQPKCGLEKHPFPLAGSLHVDDPHDTPSISATASDRFVCLYPHDPFETSAAYYTSWAEQYLALIADGQRYPQFPVEAYLVYRFHKNCAAQLADGEDVFFLKHVDNKGDYLFVDQDHNITGIIDWQMARVVPRLKAFALSLVSADMQSLCDAIFSVGERDLALAKAGGEKGSGLVLHMGDKKMRRFFWGLGLETKWAYALPLAKALLKVLGVQEEWEN